MVVFDPQGANKAGASQLYSMANFEGMLQSQLTQLYQMVLTHHRQILSIAKHNIENARGQSKRQTKQEKNKRTYSFPGGEAVETSLRAVATPQESVKPPSEQPQALLDIDDGASSASSTVRVQKSRASKESRNSEGTMASIPGKVHDDSDEESGEDALPIVPDITLTDVKKKQGLLDLKRHMKEIFSSEIVETDKYNKTGYAQSIIKHRLFEFLVLAVISANSVWVGIDAASNKADLLIDAHPIFIVVENIFCTFFCAELVLRFAAFKRKRSALTDLWYLFDGLLVTFMIFEVWVMTLLTAFTTADLNTFSPAFLRLIRVLKFCRMARVVRLLRSVPEILILLKGVAVAYRAVFFSQLLVFVIVYIFAIAYFRILEGTDVGSEYFPDLSQSMMTLFFRGCFFDGLPELATAMFKENFIMGIVLLIFVIIAPLTALNLVVGILVHVVDALEASEKEEGAQIFLEDAVTRVFNALDSNNDGTLDYDEFQLLLENETIIRALTDCGLDVLNLAEHPDALYKGEDAITMKDFITETLSLRSDKVATIKDMFMMKRMLVSEIEGMMKTSTEFLFQGPTIASRQSVKK
eukprot:TRINITY_DN14842_c0_g1_i1.p1 TRINITY_DN14842_c0_g1~~TRINITY_DN14842_c0_g1_i1.p1  ORF type:complete len:582 (-),score=100.71 TRINITY_DN14842_c0_g1_i1:87-1832(-)